MIKNLEVTKKEKTNTLFAKVTEEQYKKVYRVSQETGFSMADLIRMCVEIGLPQVEKLLKKVGDK